MEIEYEVLGNGPPIALLHGGLAGRHAFSRQRDALAGTRELIIPSFRGHDGTPWILPEDYGVSTSDVADFAAVLDAEDADRVDLIGHSSGGATAFAFASRYPGRVNRLILIEPSLLALIPPPDREQLVAGIAAIIEVGNKGDEMSALRKTMDLVAGEKWRQLDEETRAKRLTSMAHMAPYVTPHWRGLLQFDVAPADLEGLRPPTLLFYGGASYEFEALISACWRTHRPDIRQIVVEDAGHNIQLERPDIVTPAIVEFLDDEGLTR